MTSGEKEQALHEISKDFLKNFSQICRYHRVDDEMLFNAEESLKYFFEWVMEFYKLDQKNDRSGKKGLVLGVVSQLSKIRKSRLRSMSCLKARSSF